MGGGGFTFGRGNKNLAGHLLGGFFPDGGDDQIFERYCSETYSSEPTKFT